jgi:hypothetical protein
MMKKLLILSIIFLLSLNLVSASLGCFKRGTEIPIVTSLLANNITITQITTPTPDSYIIIQNQLMEKNGNSFVYNFTKTNTTGTYTYGYCDGEGNCYGNSFEVTPSGYCGGSSIAFFILVIVLIYVIAFVGVFGRNIPIALLGGGALLFLGIYLFNNGVIIFRDDITRYLSYVTIGIGALLSVWTAYEWYQDM